MTVITNPSEKIVNLGQITEAGEDTSLEMDLFKFLETRALIQASSGGGKSWLLRGIIEQTMRAQVPVWLIDPEGEYTSLREKFDVVIFGDEAADLPCRAETMSIVLPELFDRNVSCVFDLSELGDDDQQRAVVQICQFLIGLPRPKWKPLLLALDEAQKLAPQDETTPCKKSIADLAARGRKRGFGLLAATQSLAQFEKKITKLLLNRLIGLCIEDIEIKRAAEYIGKDNAKKLQEFNPGDFFAIGSALVDVRGSRQFRAGSVETTHPESTVHHADSPVPQASGEFAKIIAALREKLTENVKTAVEEKSAATKNNAGDGTRGEAENAAKKSALDDYEIKLNERAGDLRRREIALENIESEIYEKIENVFNEANLLLYDRLEKLKTEFASVLKLPASGLNLRPESKTLPVPKSSSLITGFRTGIKTGENSLPKQKLVQSENKRHPSECICAGCEDRRRKSEKLSNPQRKVLDALALCERLGVDEPKRINVAFFAGYTENGHFNNTVGNLNAAGLLHYPHGGHLALTEKGRELANAENNPAQTIAELHDLWKSKLSSPEVRVLEVLLEHHPESLDRERLAKLSGYTVNGHFNNVVGHLSTLGIAEYPQKGRVAAAHVMFPLGLE